MDPRSQATSAELNEQQRLGLEIFFELRNTRKALAEIGAVKKQIAALPAQSLSKHQEAAGGDHEPERSDSRGSRKASKAAPGAISGLDSAAMGLGAALRVVENSDRAIPSQAIELYQEADRVAKTGIADWTRLKSEQLTRLNESLKKAGWRHDSDLGDREKRWSSSAVAVMMVCTASLGVHSNGTRQLPRNGCHLSAGAPICAESKASSMRRDRDLSSSEV